jgi:hypothetical protein
MQCPLSGVAPDLLGGERSADDRLFVFREEQVVAQQGGIVQIVGGDLV